jgi:predicted O-linked N-acetylglucosamine transferase (SPINDLY family)
MHQVAETSVLISVDNLTQPSEFYEAAIAADETIVSNYWHLGVAYLLLGREDDAQVAWFTPLATAEATEIDDLTTSLVSVLEKEAQHQRQELNQDRAWLLRQHLWTLAPEYLDNILESIVLADSMGNLTSEALVEWRVSELLRSATVGSIDEDLLEQVISASIYIYADISLEVIELCLRRAAARQDTAITRMVKTTFDLFYKNRAGFFAVKLCKICNDMKPNDLNILRALGGLYTSTGMYAEATAIAEQYSQLATGIIDRLFGSYLVQRAHFTAGNHHGVEERVDYHRQLLAEIIHVQPKEESYAQCQSLIVSSFFLPYAEDNPLANRLFQNQAATLCQQIIESIRLTIIEFELKELSLQKKTGCLRIGYIGTTFKNHSVGWLARWLIHHHDHEAFQTFIYCLNISSDDNFNHKWFRDKVNITYYLDGHPAEFAAQIQADEIDILIDLDSLTFDLTCLVMAHKPAPVQISWLGWDSSGIPAVDYFIADPYVLPDDAQAYYQEQIWRLPQTYLAVDGFEIGIPTLRREDLDIPTDAIVYLSSQSGYKRHPDCIRSQMEIIKAVPNSYFLIKGKSDAETIKNFFGTLAAEVGISLDRLRFLDRDIDEPTHRANLAIADIVLDTFPYNGATTTLETLWMGIPMVTQVGQQFAARNSYTFMLNAGIEEGIAWSQAEYIEWGIKLGLDRDLRDKIAGKLRSGRTTAPVWNAKQFTLDMEQAYREMWAIYQEQNSHQAVEDYSNN